jgi:sialidase-1
MASIIRVSGREHKKSRIIFANPDSRNNAIQIRKTQPVYKPRENITARISYDEGRTWAAHRSLYPGGSGYSDLAVDKNGMIYCLYEIRDGNDSDWKYRIIMHRFNLEWLTHGKDYLH